MSILILDFNTFKRVITIIILFFSIVVRGQAPIEETKKEEKENKLSVVPYLNYNNTYEFAFGVVPILPVAINKKDTISPTSTFGLIGFYSTNDSYMAATFGRLYLDEDNWRLRYFLATGHFNNQTYVELPGHDSGGFVSFGNDAFISALRGSRKIFEDTYLGIGLAYKSYETSFGPPLNNITNASDLSTEISYSSDTRSDVYYPLSGNIIEVVFSAYPEFLGNDNTGSGLEIALNNYRTLNQNEDNVLALRAYADLGFGDVNFQRQETIGGTDLRGYSSGKYRGDGIMDVQGEYRKSFTDKVGMVLFAGAASLYGSSTESFNWEIYPNVGTGFRYKAIEATGMNVGMDFALGKDDWGLYFRIGEAF